MHSLQHYDRANSGCISVSSWQHQRQLKSNSEEDCGLTNSSLLCGFGWLRTTIFPRRQPVRWSQRYCGNSPRRRKHHPKRRRDWKNLGEQAGWTPISTGWEKAAHSEWKNGKTHHAKASKQASLEIVPSLSEHDANPWHDPSPNIQRSSRY